MNLPSGYTQLEYIQSSGTQYINTGFKSPSSGLKIALGFEYIADHSEETLFGCQKNGVYSNFFLLGLRYIYKVGEILKSRC